MRFQDFGKGGGKFFRNKNFSRTIFYHIGTDLGSPRNKQVIGRMNITTNQNNFIINMVVSNLNFFLVKDEESLNK